MRVLFFIKILFIISACKSEKITHVYSPDNDQCLTVITKGNIQYLIDGEHSKVPEKNFIKLDISEIDLAGGLYICWEDSVYQWQAIINEARIVKLNLDSTRFSFKTELPKDQKGIPTAEKFSEPNCGKVSLRSGIVFSPTKTTVKSRK